MSQIAVITEKVVTDAPLLGQGDMDAKPIPEPKVTKIRVVAAAVMAPAKIAGQDAADATDSFGRLPIPKSEDSLVGWFALMRVSPDGQCKSYLDTGGLEG